MRTLAGGTRVCGSIILLCAASSAAIAKPKATVIQARSVAEIVSAVETANQSSQPTIIRVARGRYEFSELIDTGFGAGVLPAVTGIVSIVGKDADSTIFDANGFGRIATVAPEGRLTLSRLTLTGGRNVCPGDACSQPGAGGGAAANIGGILKIKDCVLTGSSVISEAGESFNQGGAIVSWDGRLRVEDTLVTGNRAQSTGGGIALVRGRGAIINSTVSNNEVIGGAAPSGIVRGAGIHSRADLLIWGSTISGNHTGTDDPDFPVLGGGILNAEGGVMLIANSAVIENTTLPIGSGAGIYNEEALRIHDSTIGANSAGTSGGGIFNDGTLKLVGVTIAENFAQGSFLPGVGTPDFPIGCSPERPERCVSGGGGLWNEGDSSARSKRSLIATNTAGPNAPGPDCSASLISKGRNAIGDSTDCTLQPAERKAGRDLIDINPRIGDLRENGGAGEAHFPLLANSPLIDAGGKVHDACSPRDQLGQPRRDGNGDGKVRCDIGAIEFQGR